jgi:hypothetical protein
MKKRTSRPVDVFQSPVQLKFLPGSDPGGQRVPPTGTKDAARQVGPACTWPLVERNHADRPSMAILLFDVEQQASCCARVTEAVFGSCGPDGPDVGSRGCWYSAAEEQLLEDRQLHSIR